VHPLVLPPPKFVAFRNNENWAVWDHRGLTIRYGKLVKSYRLGEIAVSPRVFERDEIRKNLDLFKSGDRFKPASALSGAKRIGDSAFFLVRWDDKAGKPWLEALVRVPLDQKGIEWRLIGRYDGLSLADKAIDDKLLLDHGTLAVINRRDDGWGESFYSTTAHGFGFKKLGDHLLDFRQADTGVGLFVEATPYGTTIGGEVDLATAARREIIETHDPFSLVDDEIPMLALVTATKPALRYASSGAELTLPDDPSVRRCADGVLIWSGGDHPTSATLYDPERWTPLAQWNGHSKPKKKSDDEPILEENPSP